MAPMRFSSHFYDNQAEKVTDRAPITEEMCIEVVDDPDHIMLQRNGNIAHWRAMDIYGDGKMRYLCVITSETRDYVVTAHPDRDFLKKMRNMGVELP